MQHAHVRAKSAKVTNVVVINGGMSTWSPCLRRRPGMDLQYKYVVRNGDGSVARWMAGDNFSLQTADSDVELLPSTLRVSDSWDASVHAVEVWEHCSSPA